MTPTAPVAVTVDGHVTRLKWHRARRAAGDAPFTADRIAEGMRVGASVEIDLVLTADRGYAVLHDPLVDRATSGTGSVAEMTDADVSALYLRDNGSHILDQRVLVLDGLAALLTDLHPDAMLQLDFKETAADLDDRAVRSFAHAVTPFARHAILSCGDARAVAMLTDAVPDLHVGYDPCHHGAVHRVLRDHAHRRFSDEAVAASPRAEVIYLDRRLVFGSADRGVDLIAAFHNRGRAVDVYTFTTADDPDIDRAISCGADQITTDDAEGVAARLGSPTE